MKKVLEISQVAGQGVGKRRGKKYPIVQTLRCNGGKDCSLTWCVEEIHWAHNKAQRAWTAADIAAERRFLCQCFPKSSCRQAGLFQKASKHTSGRNEGVGKDESLCAHAEHWLQCPLDTGEWGEKSITTWTVLLVSVCSASDAELLYPLLLCCSSYTLGYNPSIGLLYSCWLNFPSKSPSKT